MVHLGSHETPCFVRFLEVSYDHLQSCGGEDRVVTGGRHGGAGQRVRRGWTGTTGFVHRDLRLRRYSRLCGDHA